MANGEEGPTGNEIAIIGMAGRFPGAATIDAFWGNLCAGVDSVPRMGKDQLDNQQLVSLDMRSRPDFVSAGGWLEDAERFDRGFFGFSAREAVWTDPQQRLFLECAWSALENASYNPHGFPGKIALYAGGGSASDYLLSLLPHAKNEPAALFEALVASAPENLATRTSFKLKLRGESMLVSTACSTGLVVVHMACQSLLLRQSDLALAGAVNVSVPQRIGYLFQDGMIGSPDGYCRAFDANAEGTVHGHGVGVVVLKRLEQALVDRDHIYAVIRGSAINNDGDQKVGFTAPSVEGQAEVIADALSYAEVNPDQIGYVEAHGTGTRLGDPVEVAALTQAYRRWTASRGHCALGSLKNNIGHLNTAAGIAGLMKAVLSLHHEEIPPHIHFERPNPSIDFDASPFFVNRRRKPWPRSAQRPRFAAVSSFGIGGTNAHAVLEQAPFVPPAASTSQRLPQLIVLSGRTENALAAVLQTLASHLSRNHELPLADIAFSLSAGRKALGHRRAIIAADVDELRKALLAPAKPADKRWTSYVENPAAAREKRVAFLFPGQDASFVGMGRDLYRSHPAFRKSMDTSAEILRPLLGWDLRVRLYPPSDEVDQSEVIDPEFGLPALYATEYAMAQLFMSWGIRPAVMFGHSFGEYVAASVAEVITQEEGLALAALRGKLMSKMPEGAMLAAAIEPSALLTLLGAECTLAAINGPGQCVISGPLVEIADAERQLRSRRVATVRLPVRRAFHSRDVEALMPELKAKLTAIRLREPNLPYVSSLTGTLITPAEATNPAYWTRQMREPVQFDTALRTLGTQQCACYLEIGPNQTLTAVARARLGGREQRGRVMPSMRRKSDARSDQHALVEALGSLWLDGIELDWNEVFAEHLPRRVPLPAYPFEVDGRDFRLPSLPELPLSATHVATTHEIGPGTNGTAPSVSPSGPCASVASREGLLPLSCVQERILNIARSDPHNPALNMQLAVELRGNLRLDLLKRAMSEMVGRHDVLRSVYVDEDGRSSQRLLSSAHLELVVLDMKAADDPRAAALDRARAEVATPFDLSVAPLARMTLLRLDEREHILVLTLHHVISDAPSLGIFLRDTMSLYAGYLEPQTPPLASLETQYADYGQWQRENLQSPAFEAQLTYWREKLAYLPGPLCLPGARPTTLQRDNLRGGRIAFGLGRGLCDGIRRISKSERVTPFWVLLAAYAALLHRLSDCDDIVIGTPIANRSRAELAPLIGYVAHSLPMRIDVSGDPTFRELLRRVRDVTMGAYAHPDIPFEWLSSELRQDADAGRSPLFDALLVMHSEMESTAKLADMDLALLDVPDAPSAPSSFGAILADLTLFINESKSGYSGAFGYSTEQFNRATAERILLQFTLLAADGVANLDRHVSELRLGLHTQAKVAKSTMPDSSTGKRKAPSFSLSYFATEDGAASSPHDKYALLVEGARFADERGFEAIWTPERHFHAFGGLFPSPAITSSALAPLTKRIRLRAGSVVLPLHDPISVAEEWAVIDNISGGRVGISFAPGWNAADFVLAPERYSNRRAEMLPRIETVRRLWRGESVRRRDGNGRELEVRLSPRPIQSELPTWLTTSGSLDAFRMAGRMGSGVLTNLLAQTLDSLREKIALYRRAFRESGRAGGRGHVTLMLHTFLGPSLADVRDRVRGPLLRYLRSSLDLTSGMATGQRGDIDARSLDRRDVDALLEHTFDRFLEGGGLFGSPEQCLTMVNRLHALDVDEVACLIDFGMDLKSTLDSLERLDELRRMTTMESAVIS